MEIELPAYADALATDFTVTITPIYNGKLAVMNAGRVEKGRFKVYGNPGPFTWLVFGKRGPVEVEPNKADVKVYGDGPYKYIGK